MLDDLSLAGPAARKRRVLQYVLKLTIGLTIVAFLLWRYDFSNVISALLRLGPNPIFWILFWTLLGLWFHSWMLQGVLRPLKMDFTTWRLFVIHLQIRFYALFLPGAANVIVKWRKLAKPGQQPAQALAVIAFTRIAHTQAVLMLAVAGMMLDGVFPWPSVQWASITLLVLTTGFMGVCISRRLGPILDKLVESMLRRVPGPARARDQVRKIWAAFQAFRCVGIRQITIVMLLTLIGQAFQTLGQIAIAHGVGADVSFWTQLWLRGVILISITVPVTLSGLGLREASMVGLLIYYGISPEVALAYSLGYFGLTVLLGLLGGLFEAQEHFLTTGKQDAKVSSQLDTERMDFK